MKEALFGVCRRGYVSRHTDFKVMRKRNARLKMLR
jgi:hypothetical protein